MPQSRPDELDRKMRQVWIAATVFLSIGALYAVVKLVGGDGAGWLVTLLATLALVALAAGQVLDEPVIFGLAFWLGLAAAGLGSAALSGLVVLKGGIGDLWQDTASGAAGAVLAAYRLLQAWRLARTGRR